MSSQIFGMVLSEKIGPDQRIGLIFQSIDRHDFEMFTSHINQVCKRSCETDKGRHHSKKILKRRFKNQQMKFNTDIIQKLMTTRESQQMMTLLEKCMIKLFETRQSNYLLFLLRNIPNINMYLH